MAAQVLTSQGASLDRVRQAVVHVLAGPPAWSRPSRSHSGRSGSPRRRSRPWSPAARRLPAGVGRAGPGDAAGPRGVPGFGVRLVLISLEIWSGWMDLRYVLLPEDQPGAQHLVDFDWQVSDDAGTGYQLMGMATGGGRLLHIYQLGFKPAPPGKGPGP